MTAAVLKEKELIMGIGFYYDMIANNFRWLLKYDTILHDNYKKNHKHCILLC